MIIFMLVWLQYWTKCVKNFALTYTQDTHLTINPPLIQQEQKTDFNMVFCGGGGGGGGGRDMTTNIFREIFVQSW